MWSKKYWRVNSKIAWKKFQKHQHHLMGVVAIFAIAFASHGLYKKLNDQSHLSTFTEWKVYQQNQTDRSPASVNTMQCNLNYVGLAQVKAEILALEKKYDTGTVLEGELYGLNFKNLKSIGSQLVADNKHLIGDATVEYNFDSCTDVPCIINKIYQDETQMSGNFIYYWYLKTGTMISSTNIIPHQESSKAGFYSGRKHNYEEFLFTKEELQNFYFLAKSLPEKLTFIPIMKSLHKVPRAVRIEGAKTACSVALPNGQILLEQRCLPQDRKSFFVNVTREIAKYVDRQEGLKKNLSSISSSKNWVDQSVWFKESYFNSYNKKFQYKWKSDLGQENFVDKRAMISPVEQVSSLIAYYRFDPVKFTNNTPSDIAQWIQSEIFHNKSFDPSGLYSQYINQAIDSWSYQEVGIWKECIDEHIDMEHITSTHRDIASSLEHPLFKCVESKVPAFINYVKRNISKENFEGCQFFTDSNQYGHVSKKFDDSIQRHLVEKVLQRKTEIRKHGNEVLIGQQIKQTFIESVDPHAVYIDCFSYPNKARCYKEEMTTKLSSIISSHSDISEYYQGIVKEDILGLFPFDNIKKDTNEMTKMFLAPYTAKLHQAANKMWDSCKLEGIDHSEPLKLPMTFSGGRHFVNAKLINCINSSVKDELFKLAELKAFHKIGNDYVEFKLKDQEQIFALSFLEGRLLQTLNNILDREYSSERVRLEDYFNTTKTNALANFTKDKKYFTDIFSFDQVSNMCNDDIKKLYPENYFYHSKSEVDNKYGRTICSTFTQLPDVKQRLSVQVRDQWLKNRKVAKGYLEENFQEYVDDCNDEYSSDRKSRRYSKDRRLRKICIEESYGQALSDSIEMWRDHEHYDFFAQKENELLNYFYGQKSQIVRKSL